MFRLGTFLFIPGYLTVTLYRVLASPESGGSLLLMIRECYLHLLSRTAHETLSPKSLDDQHVSVFRFFSSCHSLINWVVLYDIAAQPSRSLRCQFF